MTGYRVRARGAVIFATCDRLFTYLPSQLLAQLLMAAVVDGVSTRGLRGDYRGGGRRDSLLGFRLAGDAVEQRRNHHLRHAQYIDHRRGIDDPR